MLFVDLRVFVVALFSNQIWIAERRPLAEHTAFGSSRSASGSLRSLAGSIRVYQDHQGDSLSHF